MARIGLLLLLFLSLVAAQPPTASTAQKSGDCSPNVAQVQGNVTIHVSPGACPGGLTAPQMEALLNKVMAAQLSTLKTADARILEQINVAVQLAIKTQMAQAVQNREEYVRNYQESLRRSMEAYKAAMVTTAAASQPKITDIPTTFQLLGPAEYQIQAQAAGNNKLEISTDNGTTFKPFQSFSTTPVSPLSLIIRALDSSGKEILRQDKTAALKAEFTRLARAAIPTLRREEINTALSWGCNLYGCRFVETQQFGFCSPGVSKAYLSDTQQKFSYEVDRSGCSAPNYHTICEDYPHLPFPVGFGKTIYAKFEFVDGTSLVQPLPVDSQVLNLAIQGRGPNGFYPTDANWVPLEPVVARGQPAPPFAAILYAPANVVVGGYFLFIGLRGCADKGTTVKANGWLMDDDGGGLLRQAPGYGSQNGQRLSAERQKALLTNPATFQVAADTEQKGRLGPFTYHFDPVAPIRLAAKTGGAPKIACRNHPYGRPGMACFPEQKAAFLGVKSVRFGPKNGQWDSVIDAGYTAEMFLTQETGGSYPFVFEIPKEWTDVFHQIVFEDGKTSEVERFRIPGR